MNVNAISGLQMTLPTSGVEAGSAARDRAGGASFAALLDQLGSNAIDNLKNAEHMSMAGIGETASVQQVVEAVMTAEQTLQAAVTIRDKAVSAYLEISRMNV